MLYEFLMQNYMAGEPIFISDIKIKEMSDVNIRQQFKSLTDNGKLIRYENGIYYIPKKSRLKGTAGPASDTVAYYKYISRGSRVEGYYSGHTFANQIGISPQVPRKVEIVSNNIAAKRREISIGKRVYIVRRAGVLVTKENYKTLQLLDFLKNMNDFTSEGNAIAERLAEYVKNSKIMRADIDRYISAYPDATYRYFYETGLEYVLT
ncbi:hypothetical protein D3Z51_19975 [Clostridiaceae bacterium]|nr:hypothetical protein [Clostridiaceae bacterium]RKI07402.1 hypothetical protein D7V81_19990 [bacterium 1XD21-70]